MGQLHCCNLNMTYPLPPSCSHLRHQPYGPTRSPVSPGTPPSRTADAVAVMAAIETSTSWQRLVDTVFPQVWSLV